MWNCHLRLKLRGILSSHWSRTNSLEVVNTRNHWHGLGLLSFVLLQIHPVQAFLVARHHSIILFHLWVMFMLLTKSVTVIMHAFLLLFIIILDIFLIFLLLTKTLIPLHLRDLPLLISFSLMKFNCHLINVRETLHTFYRVPNLTF